MGISKNNRIDLSYMASIRKTLHQFPEMGLEEQQTSDFIANHLEILGYQVHRGIAGTGVVGTLKKGTAKRSIGIRSDMDGLPIIEQTDLPYASQNHGKMHACGHDGHMAMLLGAAKAIAQKGKFNGTVNLIFQPAEENLGGGKQMVAEGLFERFPCDAVFALHNAPDQPFGIFALRKGPIMAAVDEVHITVQGCGGHGAYPEETADPIVAGAGIVMALQTIISRNIKATEPAVVTVGSFHGGSASNIIPNDVKISITIRTFDDNTRNLIEKRITETAQYQARSYGMTALVEYYRGYDATVNHPDQTDFIQHLAIQFAGAQNVVHLERPMMGSEDFTYMLQACPGCLFFLGTKITESFKPLHHPEYDFNDDILPVGAGFWFHLVEEFLAGNRELS